MKTGNTAGKINLLLTEQFAIDYGCTVEDFCSKETLVTELRPNDRARKREELGVLSMLSFHGKLVIAVAPELMDWSRSVLAKHCSAEWCFEAGTLMKHFCLKTILKMFWAQRSIMMQKRCWL